MEVQRRIDSMFAGTDVGFSGPEMLEYFSRFDSTIEQYPWSGGAPSRKQILQDCLSRFTKEQQLGILNDLLRPENYKKYSPPPEEDQNFLRSWITAQIQGNEAPSPLRSIPTVGIPAQIWDVFISHAWEDKKLFAEPLAKALIAKGIKVWFDIFTLTLGDSLRRSIDRGLSQSQFGIVILSHHFFQKHWPQLELDGLVAREANGKKVIIPIWHNITEKQVREYSPILADRIAVSSEKGVNYIVDEICRAISNSRSA